VNVEDAGHRHARDTARDCALAERDGSREHERRGRIAVAFQTDFTDFSSRIERSLLSVLTATSNTAEVIEIVPWDSVSAALPVIDEVRPTASLCAGRNPSFSRTR